MISQVYGGRRQQRRDLTNDYIEIFNPTTHRLSWRAGVVQYASAAGTGNFAGELTPLTGIAAAGPVLPRPGVARRATGRRCPRADATGAIAMAATAGKVALANTTTGVPCNGSSPVLTDASSRHRRSRRLRRPATSSRGAARRRRHRRQPPLRATAAAPTRTTTAPTSRPRPPAPRNTASPTHPVTGRHRRREPAQRRPASVAAGGSSLLTVAVTPGANPASTGLAVACDLTAIGGSATQTFFDNGTNGDVTAGDGTFSYAATVDRRDDAGEQVAALHRLGRRGSLELGHDRAGGRGAARGDPRHPGRGAHLAARRADRLDAPASSPREPATASGSRTRRRTRTTRPPRASSSSPRPRRRSPSATRST